MYTQNKKQSLKNKKLYTKNFLKTRKRIKQNVLRVKSSGRPYKNYKFLMSSSYLYVSITVRPNNIFCAVRRVEKLNTKNNTLKNSILLSKTAGAYGVKISKKGLKSKTLAVVLKFLKDLKLTQFKGSEFLVLSIVAPIKLRKKLIQFLSKSLIRSIFLKRQVILEIKSKKVFNGCTPCKQRRKKRKGFRVLK
jgi:hypothetical protein